MRSVGLLRHAQRSSGRAHLACGGGELRLELHVARLQRRRPRALHAQLLCCRDALALRNTIAVANRRRATSALHQL